MGKRRRWLIIFACLSAQYVHGVATQLAYARHVPGAPLRDAGAALLPDLSSSRFAWVSEALFGVMFFAFVAWSMAPLLWPKLRRSRVSVVVLWTRLLVVLVANQALRVASFTATSLPGPAPHCAPGVAHPPVLRRWWHAFVVDVRRQVAHSCGDLIFSSHMTFLLVGALAFTHYQRGGGDDDNGSGSDSDSDGDDSSSTSTTSSSRWRGGGKAASTVLPVVLVWLSVAASALLIVAAHKHYTVDVVVAVYTVPLVFYALHSRWERAGGAACSACSAFSAVPALCSGGGGCCCGAAGTTIPSGGSKQQRGGKQHAGGGAGRHDGAYQKPGYRQTPAGDVDDVEAQALV